jgi:hypothetical protein
VQAVKRLMKYTGMPENIKKADAPFVGALFTSFNEANATHALYVIKRSLDAYDDYAGLAPAEAVLQTLLDGGEAGKMVAETYKKIFELASRTNWAEKGAEEVKDLVKEQVAVAKITAPDAVGEFIPLADLDKQEVGRGLPASGVVDDYISTHLSISRESWGTLPGRASGERGDILKIEPNRLDEVTAALNFNPAGPGRGADMKNTRNQARGSSGDSYGPPAFHVVSTQLRKRGRYSEASQSSALSARSRGAATARGLSRPFGGPAYPPGTRPFEELAKSVHPDSNAYSDQVFEPGLNGHCKESTNFNIRIQQIGHWQDPIQRCVALCRLGSSVRHNEMWRACVQNGAPSLQEFIVVWARILLETYYTYALGPNAGEYSYAYPHVVNYVDGATLLGQVSAFWTASARANPFAARVIPGAMVSQVVAGAGMKLVPAGGLQDLYRGGLGTGQALYDIRQRDYQLSRGYSALVFQVGFGGVELPDYLPLVGNSPLSLLHVSNNEAMQQLVTHMWCGSLFFDAVTGVNQLNAQTTHAVNNSPDRAWGTLVGDFDTLVPRAGMLCCRRASERYDGRNGVWVKDCDGTGVFYDECQQWRSICSPYPNSTYIDPLGRM